VITEVWKRPGERESKRCGAEMEGGCHTREMTILIYLEVFGYVGGHSFNQRALCWILHYKSTLAQSSKLGPTCNRRANDS
jgi:hypothetical protein